MLWIKSMHSEVLSIHINCSNVRLFSDLMKFSCGWMKACLKKSTKFCFENNSSTINGKSTEWEIYTSILLLVLQSSPSMWGVFSVLSFCPRYSGDFGLITNVVIFPNFQWECFQFLGCQGGLLEICPHTKVSGFTMKYVFYYCTVRCHNFFNMKIICKCIISRFEVKKTIFISLVFDFKWKFSKRSDRISAER